MRGFAMSRVVRFISFAPTIADGERARLAAHYAQLAEALPGLVRERNAPPLPGSVNGGDLVSHLVFDGERGWNEARVSPEWHAIEAFCARPEVTRSDWASYVLQHHGVREPDIAEGIHRVLLLAVRPETSAERRAQFENEMRAMPHYLPAIRNWNLSRVSECGGARSWTHVWEQDFRSPADFFGPYMMHPIHFALIDRWFDPQSQDWIVDPELCSTYCLSQHAAIAQNDRKSA